MQLLNKSNVSDQCRPASGASACHAWLCSPLICSQALHPLAETSSPAPTSRVLSGRECAASGTKALKTTKPLCKLAPSALRPRPHPAGPRWQIQPRRPGLAVVPSKDQSSRAGCQRCMDADAISQKTEMLPRGLFGVAVEEAAEVLIC